ncbi:NPC intracellular cholesterol transporter 2 homolog a-like [Rhodnius prolixus]|uniref:Putative ml domain protein n=1 Tax=Rhodnius prolixus TaxID=13249 RepID=R4G7X9_RHOPR
MNSISAICFLISVLYASATNYTECDGKRKPIALNVPGCESLPCKFIRSQISILNLDFEADEDITDLKPQVRVKAMGTDMYFPLPQHDACLGIINGECPLDQGEEVTYQLQMPIQTTFPKLSFQVEFSLISSGRTVSCVKLNGEVVDP